MTSLVRTGLFILVTAAALGAAENGITLHRSHDIWNRASGFAGGYVYSMTQTADGYLWIGTSDGLLRYDGLSFDFVRRANSIALTNEPIEGLVTDSGDHLWATDDNTHLFRYEAGVLQGPIPDNGRHQHLVSSVTKSFDGWLLFASELQGIVEYKQREHKVLLEARQLPGATTAIAQTPDGKIWIGTAEKGLFQFNPGRGDTYLHKVTSVPNMKINCLLPVASSTLLVGTDVGLLELHTDAPGHHTQELGHDVILALANGQQGDVWIGTKGRVLKANTSATDPTGKVHLVEMFAVQGTITALFEDRDGNLWVGEEDAIERFRDSSFVSYLSDAGLPCTNCGAIYVDPHQDIWFAPRDGGLFRIAESKIQSIEIAGLNKDTVYSITGHGDEVWIARKAGGLTRLLLQGHGLQASTYSKQSGLAENAVYAVYREPNGTVWAGTANEGLSRFRHGIWRTFTAKDGLPSNTILTITGNAAGQIFVGTPTGLAEFTNEHWVSYQTHDGLPPGAIQSLTFDEASTLWIGTSKGIAFLRSGGVHVPLGAPNPLYGDILGMVELHDWLWISTNDHVLRVRCSSLAMQQLAGGDYREFGVADGLPSAEGIKRSNSVVRDSRGDIWLSLNQGISELRASSFTGRTFPVKIRIDGMAIDGRSVAASDEVVIPSGRHRLTFRYAGVNVSNPEGVRYRYQMKGLDSGWSEPTSLREIDFTNLLPGRYQFEVAASNADGEWSPRDATIGFEVEPSLLQTRWAQLAIVGVLALIALGTYRLRVQQLHRQFSIGFEARVNERTRIARDLHDTLLQTLHGLMFQFQAVRNLLPHRAEEAMKSLDDAIDETERALAESRDAIQGLRSEPTAKGDLAGLLMDSSRELAHSANPNQRPPVFDLVEEGEQQVLSPTAKNEVCRIALEILRNAYRHAEANRIEAEVRYGDHALRVRIRDDGRGIDPGVLREGGVAGHWGLRGVRERADRIGAQLEFWSEAGAGTEVQLTVPASVAYESPRGRRGNIAS